MPAASTRRSPCKRHVIELRQDDAEAWHGLGIALRDAGRIGEAAGVFERAIELGPSDPEIRFNLALAQLHLENFTDGWGNYETRWQLDRQKKREFAQAWWHGGPFAGKTLLLFAEQGFGDTIQFIRFLPQVKAQGGHGRAGVPEGAGAVDALGRGARPDRRARHARGRGRDGGGRPRLPAGEPAGHLQGDQRDPARESPLPRPARGAGGRSSTPCWRAPATGCGSASSGRAASPSPTTPTARPASPRICASPRSRACSCSACRRGRGSRS